MDNSPQYKNVLLSVLYTHTLLITVHIHPFVGYYPVQNQMIYSQQMNDMNCMVYRLASRQVSVLAL